VDRRRVMVLERELHRKDKALAETAALLSMDGKWWRWTPASDRSLMVWVIQLRFLLSE
jgi:hypothetical protein